MDEYKVIDDYLFDRDWRVRENANTSYSIQGLNFHIVGHAIANYWLDKLFPPHVSEMHKEGYIHLHDLSMLSAYTYDPDNAILVKDEYGNIRLFTFEELYRHLDVEEVKMEDDVYVKFVGHYRVYDDGNWVDIVKVTKKELGKSMYRISNRIDDVVVTEDHPMITKDSVVQAKDLTTEHFLKSLSINEYDGSMYTWIDINIKEELLKRKRLMLDNDPIYINGYLIDQHFDEEYYDLYLYTKEDSIYNAFQLDYNMGYIFGSILFGGTKEGSAFVFYNDDIYSVESLVNTLSSHTIKTYIEKVADSYRISFDNRFFDFVFSEVLDFFDGLRFTLSPYIFEFNKDFLYGLIDSYQHYYEKKVEIPYNLATKMKLLMRVMLNHDDHVRYDVYRSLYGEVPEGWYKVSEKEKIDVAYGYIYDITTSSGTLMVNGMHNHNCAGWDLMDLIKVGFTGVPGKISSKPAKHLSVLLGHINNFLYTMQNEFAGAVALSNVDTLLAPFVYYDQLSYNRLKQLMQEFIFNLNVSTRIGMQVPFTNISMDLVPPKYLKYQNVVIGGEEKSKTYGDFQDQMDMINNAMAEIFLAGDGAGRPFTFPIPNYNITRDFDWDSNKLKAVFEMTAKYGIPYWSNFINSDLDPSDIRSMCLYPDELLYIRKEGKILETTIKDLVIYLKDGRFDSDGWADVRFDNDVDVLSYNPVEKKLEWVKVSKVLRIYDSVIIEVTLKSGKVVRFSKGHIIPYADKNGNISYKTADKLQVNERIIVLDSIVESVDDLGLDKFSKYHYESIVNINKIQLSELQDFYDIELEKNHLFIHSGGVITHNCCHLRLDKRELRNKGGGGLFGAGALTGSVSVTTINLPRLGYLAKDENDYIEKLDFLLDIAKDASITRRRVVEEMMERNLYPYAKFYLRSIKQSSGKYFDNHFSTVGIIGMNESCLNFAGEPITTPECTQFAIRIMNFIRDKLSDFQEETGYLFNLEAVPGEGASYRLAKHDIERFPDIRTAGTRSRPYYTNSTMPPVDWTDDIFEFLEHQNKLLPLYTGGSVAHIYLGERIYSLESIKKLIRTVAENFEIPYYTITPSFSICPKHGYIPGEHEFCPLCDAELLEKKRREKEEKKIEKIDPMKLTLNVV